MYPTLFSASEMTYIVSSGALNSTHSLTPTLFIWRNKSSVVWIAVGLGWQSSLNHRIAEIPHAV